MRSLRNLTHDRKIILFKIKQGDLKRARQNRSYWTGQQKESNSTLQSKMTEEH